MCCWIINRGNVSGGDWVAARCSPRAGSASRGTSADSARAASARARTNRADPASSRANASTQLRVSGTSALFASASVLSAEPTAASETRRSAAARATRSSESPHVFR